MTPAQVRLVQESFRAASSQRNRLTALFLAELSARDPSLRPLFRGPSGLLGAKLFDGLSAIVASLNRLDPFVPALEWLAIRHARMGVGPRHYAVISTALVAVLQAGLGLAFKPEHREAWTAACREVGAIMTAALEPQPLAA